MSIAELACAITTQNGLDLMRRVESFLDGWVFEDEEMRAEAQELYNDVATAIALCADGIEKRG